MIIRPRLLLAAAALLVTACAAAPPAEPAASEAHVDPQRARLLGALPAEEAQRGVYVIDLESADELSPGSRLAPVVAPLVDDAELLIETGAPPVTLLGGVDGDVATPAEAVRVDDVLVIASPDAREAVAQRLRDGARPEGLLVRLAAADSPVVWGGPTPAPDGSGTTVVALSQPHVSFEVEHDLAREDAEAHATRELAEGGPSGSPGKRWTSIVEDAEVTTMDGHLVITGTPADLPGLFLPVLIDQRQMTFLPSRGAAAG